MSFTVTASDPDGQAIETLSAAPIPAGATFVTSGIGTLSASGVFSWTPSSGQAGAYSVVFTATDHSGVNLRTGSATTSITIATGDHAPAVSAPPGINGGEEGVIAFGVSASDADGDPISSLVADLTSLPTGNDATFTPSGDNSSGTFLWHPAVGHAGFYSATFTATANGLTGTASTSITVAPSGTGTTGLFTWTPTVPGTYTVVFTATNPDGSASFTSTINVLPADASAVTPPSGSNLSTRSPATLSPQAPQKGPVISGTGTTTTKAGTTTTLSVYATDTTLLSMTPEPQPLRAASITASAAATQNIDITADLTQTPGATFDVDHQPGVFGPASVTGNAGASVTVTVGVVDPEDDPIASLTVDTSSLPAGANVTFTKNGTNTIGTLTWVTTLADAGTYTVTFTAKNLLVGQASTAITINPVAAARIFMSGPQKIRLGSNRPTVCFGLEAQGGSFILEDVSLASIRLISVGTGSVSEIIPNNINKSVIIGDRDNNGIEDMTLCFSKTDLRQLFSLLNGKNTVTLTMRGQLQNGATFAGQISVEVIASGGPALASALVSPNPLNPSAKLSLTLSKPGMLRVNLYDSQGRLIRQLVNETNAGAGPREIMIDGHDSRGVTLSSGVYYYKIESTEGVKTGSFAVVR